MTTGILSFSVTVTEGAPRARAYLYIYEDDGAGAALRPGDLVTGEIRVRSAMLRGEERAHTLTSAGRTMSGYFRGEFTVIGRWRMAWLYFPQRIARYVSESCLALFPGRTGVFMKALLTGDKEELYADVELYGDMRAAGVLHAVAVSGMHVFVLVAFLQRVFGRGRRTTLLCLPVMGLFVLMSGAGASVVRAALMQTLYMGAPLFDRESDSPSSLSAALLLLLLVNPMSIGGIGLQLSFACMIGYAVILPKLHRRIARSRRLRRGIAGVLARNAASTISATAFSIPVAAYYFGSVPLLSIFANLLALPMIEVCFAGGYVLCILRALIPAAAHWLAWALSWGVRWCLLVFRCIGRLPFACLYMADPKAVVWLIFAYALFLGWLLMRRRGAYILPWIPAELALLGLCAVFLWNEGALRLGRRELVAADVGQGECVLLFDRDFSVAVDCGGSGRTNAGDAAADILCSAGVRKLDLLVLTHLHEDHTNGVETLLYRLPVGTIVLPAENAEPESLDAILTAADRYGTEVLLLDEPCEIALGELSVRLVLPRAGTEDNERGIVALAEVPGFSALLMGDAGTAAEYALLERGFAPDVDVLLVGHHGSKSASGPLFLRAVQAETAVISVGQNSYGLPAEEIVERLERYCGEVLRTDEDGTVRISLQKEG